MDDNLENFRDMKTMWMELNNRLSSLEDVNRKLSQDVRNSRFKSSLEGLASRYRRFIFIGLLMAIVIPLTILHNPLTVEKYRYVTVFYWSFFFLFEASIDYFLMIRLKEMDIYKQSVTEIAKKAAQNWKFHKIAIAIGMPLAVGAIVLFALVMNANSFTLLGMLVGLVIGAIIGINQLLKFKKDYKELQLGD